MCDVLPRAGREAGWFPQGPPSQLMEVKGFATRQMVACVQDESEQLERTRELLCQELGQADAWQHLDVRSQVPEFSAHAAIAAAPTHA